MCIEEVIENLTAIAKFHSGTKCTFANNKVPITKIVFDENTNSVNFR